MAEGRDAGAKDATLAQARGLGWWREAVEWAAVQVELRAVCWLPPLGWTLLASYALAPAIDDAYHREQLSNVLWSRAAPSLPKLFPLFFATYFLAPAAGCAILTVAVRVATWRTSGHPPKTKAE